MARQKRQSAALNRARQRGMALASIDGQLDLGNGLTLAAYGSAIDGVAAKQDTYNALLSQADALLTEIKADEKALNTLSGRMLGGVRVKFGPDSNEYEQAGGTRSSAVNRGRKPQPPPSPYSAADAVKPNGSRASAPGCRFFLGKPIKTAASSLAFPVRPRIPEGAG